MPFVEIRDELSLDETLYADNDPAHFWQRGFPFARWFYFAVRLRRNRRAVAFSVLLIRFYDIINRTFALADAIGAGLRRTEQDDFSTE